MNNMDCKHKYMIRCEDGYIPDYRGGAGTGAVPSCIPVPMVAVRQWRCLCCEMRFGYLNNNQIEIDPNIIKPGIQIGG